METAVETNDRRVVKTWSRRSTVLARMVGITFAVHNGKKFLPVFVTETWWDTSLGNSRDAHLPRPCRRQEDQGQEITGANHGIESYCQFVRVSPRKTRLVARNVKGMPVEAAMNLLRFTPNKPAGVILGVVRSALANAEHNASMDVDALVVKEILVNERPYLEAVHAARQGRATNIHKRTSHITVILAEGQE